MKNNARGFSLTEVLIAVVILSIAVFTTLGAVSATTDAMLRGRLFTAKTRLANSMTNLAGLPSTIRASIIEHDENADLRDCVNGAKPSLNDAPYRAFRLYMPVVQMVSPTKALTSGALTGTVDKPVRYNASGESCDSLLHACPTSEWPIEVFAEYKPICPPVYDDSYNDDLRGGKAFYQPLDAGGGFKSPPQPAVCRQARYIDVRITIKNSSLNPANSTNSAKTVANVQTFQKVVGIDVAQILKEAPP